ncbi:uncharacterized protein BDR25DRAFT_316700 [Lindgomyces ingoldianus]|uniref:Uncharacterized protein n=1 Tax=Lindgomyces ingoldianus TaxID=673940 RepID=A0ACB6QLA5_9PLEO|nr:uncharacterized protein BDR25DRAFT_316700 [Lindgomyces ingoldianus]KAF2467701.1 hypothetical protein BDR25DRAFT_316700 [Lindgomyces ingoldianus]
MDRGWFDYNSLSMLPQQAQPLYVNRPRLPPDHDTAPSRHGVEYHSFTGAPKSNARRATSASQPEGADSVSSQPKQQIVRPILPREGLQFLSPPLSPKNRLWEASSISNPRNTGRNIVGRENLHDGERKSYSPPSGYNSHCASEVGNSQNSTLSLNCGSQGGLTKSVALPDASPVNRWQQAQEYRRKVYQVPYRDPRLDFTIVGVEQNAEFWVGQLALAMTNVHNVKDREGSHAMKMFLPNVYDPLLVEATCRDILRSLIDRCKNGFRGPNTFNKAIKPGKELEADKTATCEERLSNIIRALTWNKRVCKDVLYDDWKIRLLVNHPLAYDREKDSQKGSNDQRRLRHIKEREKLKKTEEELRAYQIVNTQTQPENTSEQTNLTRSHDSTATVSIQQGNYFAERILPHQPPWTRQLIGSSFSSPMMLSLNSPATRQGLDGNNTRGMKRTRLGGGFDDDVNETKQAKSEKQ